jgi:putative SOS response-associated peptidase YedK
MCGRGASVYDRESVARFVVAEEVDSPQLPPSWNVASTQDIYVAATSSSGARKLRALRWGLVPHSAKDPRAGSRLINARAETLAERPAYRGLLRSHRGLAVFSGFYEWWRPGTGVKVGKQPYYFRLANGGPWP